MEVRNANGVVTGLSLTRKDREVAIAALEAALAYEDFLRESFHKRGICEGDIAERRVRTYEDWLHSLIHERGTLEVVEATDAVLVYDAIRNQILEAWERGQVSPPFRMEYRTAT